MYTVVTVEPLCSVHPQEDNATFVRFVASAKSFELDKELVRKERLVQRTGNRKKV